MPDLSYPSREMVLQFLLDHLLGTLEELNVVRPHDPLHPLYDRYFYEDCLTCAYEEPGSVQGVLKAINEVRALIREEEGKHRGYHSYISLLENADIDPDGEYEILASLLPALKDVVNFA